MSFSSFLTSLTGGPRTAAAGGDEAAGARNPSSPPRVSATASPSTSPSLNPAKRVGDSPPPPLPSDGKYMNSEGRDPALLLEKTTRKLAKEGNALKQLLHGARAVSGGRAVGRRGAVPQGQQCGKRTVALGGGSASSNPPSTNGSFANSNYSAGCPAPTEGQGSALLLPTERAALITPAEWSAHATFLLTATPSPEDPLFAALGRLALFCQLRAGGGDYDASEEADVAMDAIEAVRQGLGDRCELVRQLVTVGDTFAEEAMASSVIETPPPMDMLPPSSTTDGAGGAKEGIVIDGPFRSIVDGGGGGASRSSATAAPSCSSVSSQRLQRVPCRGAGRSGATPNASPSLVPSGNGRGLTRDKGVAGEARREGGGRSEPFPIVGSSSSAMGSPSPSASPSAASVAAVVARYQRLREDCLAVLHEGRDDALLFGALDDVAVYCCAHGHTLEEVCIVAQHEVEGDAHGGTPKVAPVRRSRRSSLSGGAPGSSAASSPSDGARANTAADDASSLCVGVRREAQVVRLGNGQLATVMVELSLDEMDVEAHARRVREVQEVARGLQDIRDLQHLMAVEAERQRLELEGRVEANVTASYGLAAKARQHLVKAAKHRIVFVTLAGGLIGAAVGGPIGLAVGAKSALTIAGASAIGSVGTAVVANVATKAGITDAGDAYEQERLDGRK